MHITELPNGTYLGTSAEVVEIRAWLKMAVGSRTFSRYDIILGGPSSIRLLLTSIPLDFKSVPAVSLPHPLTSDLMAKELMRSLSEMRLGANPSGDPYLRPGLELQSTLIGEQPAVIAIARLTE